MSGPLHIGVLTERRYLSQPQPAGLISALLELGHRVTLMEDELVVLELGSDRRFEGLDLVVCRGRSWAVLASLASVEKEGIPTINGRAAIGRVHNKAEMAVALEGVAPVAATFVGSLRSLAQRIPPTKYPLVVKPIFGDNCQGIRVVHSRDELEGLAWDDPVALAQEYFANGGLDLKLYGIGDEVWAVRKPSPLSNGCDRSPAVAPQPIEVTPALQQLGRKCGRLFGLDLYGVDCIETPDGPMVVEVNEFPTYTGIPDANQKLSEFVVRQVKKRIPR